MNTFIGVLGVIFGLFACLAFFTEKEIAGAIIASTALVCLTWFTIEIMKESRKGPSE